MRIPENKIEEIRASANIVDIISEYVQLRKRGKNYIGLCPFHNEKTPSFTVSDEKQIFHCFGCHAGGNVYKFLMDYEKISFVEAVQELAERQGIPLEFSEDTSERQTEQEVLYDLNTEAARYFSDNLLNRPEGEIARKYFHERKIKPQAMRAFGLGYAMPDWDDFINFAQSKKLDLERALTLGLIGQRNDGRLYDKFMGRIKEFAKSFTFAMPEGFSISAKARQNISTRPNLRSIRREEFFTDSRMRRMKYAGSIKQFSLKVIWISFRCIRRA